MTYTEKRQAKRLAAVLITLAYFLMAAWAIIIFYGLITALTAEREEVIIRSGMIWLVGVAPIVLIFILGGLGQRHIDKRSFYKRAIAEYRQCRFFTTSIQKILAGDKKSRDAAVKAYDLLIEDTPRRRFMYAFIVSASYYSKDKETAAKGKERLEVVLETYNPENVVMSK